MRIIVADRAGACYGVERALKIVLKASKDLETVHTLGPLIHNPIVVSDLEDKGIGVVNDVDQPSGTGIVIRSHGVIPSVEKQARDNGLNVIDATCPFVKKVHVNAAKLEKEGYQVVIVGEAGHPEVEGILGHAPSASVVGSKQEAIDLKVGRKVGIVVQTTQSASLLRDVVSEIAPRCDELRVINTICEATSERQDAAATLASKADCMIIVGGKMSANTTRLYEICAGVCSNTHHIESKDEIDACWFEGVDTLGVTAGASTPESHIMQVKEYIEELVENKCN